MEQPFVQPDVGRHAWWFAVAVKVERVSAPRCGKTMEAVESFHHPRPDLPCDVADRAAAEHSEFEVMAGLRRRFQGNVQHLAAARHRLRLAHVSADVLDSLLERCLSELVAGVRLRIFDEILQGDKPALHPGFGRKIRNKHVFSRDGIKY